MIAVPLMFVSLGFMLGSCATIALGLWLFARPK